MFDRVRLKLRTDRAVLGHRQGRENAPCNETQAGIRPSRLLDRLGEARKSRVVNLRARGLAQELERPFSRSLLEGEAKKHVCAVARLLVLEGEKLLARPGLVLLQRRQAVE